MVAVDESTMRLLTVTKYFYRRKFATFLLILSVMKLECLDEYYEQSKEMSSLQNFNYTKITIEQAHLLDRIKAGQYVNVPYNELKSSQSKILGIPRIDFWFQNCFELYLLKCARYTPILSFISSFKSKGVMS